MGHPFNDDLKEILDSDEAYEFLPSGTWMAGGCALLAESLYRLIPDSQLKFVGRLHLDYQDHVVLMIENCGEHVFIDYDGLQSESELISKMKVECRSDDIGVTDYVESKTDEFEVNWLRDEVPRFTTFLESRMGAIDADRVSLAWVDDEPDGLSLR